MDKINFVTKDDFEQVINNISSRARNNPKPILGLLVVIMMFIITIVGLCLLLVTLIIYSLVFWIDIIIGKYLKKDF